MRNLNFTRDSPQSIKLGDSSDTLSLRVTELDQPVDLSKVSSITVKIGNTAGFITEINVDVSSLQHPTDGTIDVVVNSKTSSKLPAGQYLIEVWINDTNGNTVIYPDTSYPSVIGFSIKKNIMVATSTVITTLTLADFEAKFDDMQKGIQGPQGIQGVKGDIGPTGIQGPKGDTGAVGAQGIQGPTGQGFSIAKIYPSVAEMMAAKGAGLTTGDFVIIASTVSSPDNATLYTWNGTTYVEIADLSGAQGIQGPQGIQGVKGDMGATGPTGPQGIQGPKGDQGIKGDNAVINIVTQAQYNALTDKSGVYFIEG